MQTVAVLLQGVQWTLVLTLGGVAIGALLGIPLVLMRRSSSAALRLPARTVIELTRGIPPIVWLFIIYFGIGTYVPQVDPLSAALVGFGVISAGYMAEIYRGGWHAVGRGQEEAAAALALPRSRALIDVVGPQILRVSLPAAATYAIGLLKDSSVAFTIGVTDIMYFANAESRATADALTPFLLAALVYVALTVPCAWASRVLDARLRKAVAR